VIITGGTGFIGHPLSLRLVQEGYEVVCLTRNAEAAEEKWGSRVQFVDWDAKTAAGWGEYAEGAEAIINLAGDSIGSGRWTEEKRRKIRQSRMNAGRAVVEAVKSTQRKPEVVIQASAIGIYGNRGKETLNESSGLGEGFLADVAKDWEGSTKEMESWGVRRAVVRTGLVLGSNGGTLPRMLLPYRFFVGGPLGSGKQWMSWIHIRDEIESFLFLMDRKDLKGVFNLTAPHPLQNKLFSRELGKAMGRPSWFPVPSFLLKLIFGQMAEETILTSQRVMPTRLEEAGFTFTFPDIPDALADILGKKF
jgi:uncharacterized protein (TIGR01777 family)